MLIVKIASKPHIPDGFLENHGIFIKNVVPSRFSFLTSMRLATTCKQSHPDAVFVNTPADAAAAVSARSLNTESTNPPYPIIFFAEHSTRIPRSLSRSTAENLQAIVFDSENTHKAWQSTSNLEGISRHSVVEPFGLDIPFENNNGCERTDSTLTLLHVGSLADPTRLDRVLSAVAANDLSDKVNIRVLGTGAARYVMPVVKRSRANRLNIDWLGEDYEPEAEFALAAGFIQASAVPDFNELRLMANGVPQVSADNIVQWTDSDFRTKMRSAAIETYLARFNSALYAEKIRDIIINCK